MTAPANPQPRPPLALLADWIESELAWIAAPMGSVAECNARDTVEPLHTSLLSLDPAALRAQAEAWGVVEAIATTEPPIGAQEARIFAQKALAQAGGEC